MYMYMHDCMLSLPQSIDLIVKLLDIAHLQVLQKDIHKSELIKVLAE